MKLGANEYVLKNLLTEKRLLELLEQMKAKIRVSQEGSPFRNAEQERDYYIRLLRSDSGEQTTKDKSPEKSYRFAIYSSLDNHFGFVSCIIWFLIW